MNQRYTTWIIMLILLFSCSAVSAQEKVTDVDSTTQKAESQVPEQFGELSKFLENLEAFEKSLMQEKQKQDVNELISSLPYAQQRSFKALGLRMYEQLLLKPISEADVRKIMVPNMEKVAEITHPKTTEMLLNHTKLALYYSIMNQIEQIKSKIFKAREIIEILRREIQTLKEILTSWPEQTSEQKITYGSAVQQSDDSWKLIEQTQLMNKEQVQNLIHNLEIQIAKMNEMCKMLYGDLLENQDTMNNPAQNYQTISKMLMTMHDAAMAAIRNIRP